METYAQVLLPLPLNATFTYRVPHEMTDRARVGFRVIVPFGRKRFYTGIIQSLSPKAPEGFEIRDIALTLDDTPIIRHPQLKLWDWLADYYLCAPGDVYKAAVPAGLKIESETFVEVNPDFELEDGETLSEREAIIQQTLDHEGALTIDAISTKTGLKGVQAVVNRMIERGIIIISEKLVERYRAKREPYVVPQFDHNGLQEAFTLVKGAKKQETLLLALIEMTRLQHPSPESPREVSRAALLARADCSASILKELEKKGLVSQYKKEINRFAYDGARPVALPRLSEAQSKALDEIHHSWIGHDITLLHGVTSSGKTEIYQHLIADVIRRGKQALYLVPEIALTTQLTKRLQAVFGERVIIYHSKFTDNERVDIWRRLLSDPSPCVVIGARSALFLPFASLGMVIVDEEHEQSYKQFDPAPRYNARDSAIVLASMHGAKTLLGSATPSIETYYKACEGKFGLVSLTKRYNDAPLPDIELIDMTRERKARNTSGTFSLETVARARHTLECGNQAIFFQPRRGYSPMARCRQCAWTPRCNRCDVALTYHRDINQLVCHYCGTSHELPRVCPQCKEPAIE
ncbi:MAG: primosomal protein N', partial [Muribaculaceae bacterium]|nr:primosomal protein N' [Muribaculaceae bacterium]